MQHTYFLGANSENGFRSLYSGFASGENDFLRIIKGGPGTGKSGFMRRIGEAAEAHGYDTEYVLCSGDPDSLDGVYIPALSLGFMDGTAPHAADPAVFAVSGDYLDLGRFCRGPVTDNDRKRIRALSRDYKALYDRAYDYLHAAAHVRRASLPELMTESAQKTLFDRIDSVIASLSAVYQAPQNLSPRFISAYSCKGRLVMQEEFSALRVYSLESSIGLAPQLLDYAAKCARDKGLTVISCPSPLEPERLEAVMLPQCGAAFADSELGIDAYQRIRCDAAIPIIALKAAAKEQREGEALFHSLTELAAEKLRRAKALHDELESVYRPYMDFDALTRFTDEYIDNLFIN